MEKHVHDIVVPQITRQHLIRVKSEVFNSSNDLSKGNDDDGEDGSSNCSSKEGDEDEEIVVVVSENNDGNEEKMNSDMDLKLGLKTNNDATSDNKQSTSQSNSRRKSVVLEWKQKDEVNTEEHSKPSDTTRSTSASSDPIVPNTSFILTATKDVSPSATTESDLIQTMSRSRGNSILVNSYEEGVDENEEKEDKDENENEDRKDSGSNHLKPSYNSKFSSLTSLDDDGEGEDIPLSTTELEFLRLYRCCDRDQSREVYAMDDNFLHYRNTTLRHYLQTTWIWIMFVWMICK